MSDTIFSLQLSTRIPTWAAAPTALQTHYQRGRQQDFVPGMRVPRSGLPRVFDSALAYISMQTPGGRCICTSSCLTRAKHSWRTCRSLPPSQTHARQPPPGLYTPRPCAIKINPRTRIAAAKGQHSTERVSTAHSHTWTTGAPAGCGSTVARERRGERRVAGMPRSARGVGPVPSVVQDQSASPRRRPLRRRRVAARVGRDADKRVASENLEQLRFKLSGDRDF